MWERFFERLGMLGFIGMCLVVPATLIGCMGCAGLMIVALSAAPKSAPRKIQTKSATRYASPFPSQNRPKPSPSSKTP